MNFDLGFNPPYQIGGPAYQTAKDEQIRQRDFARQQYEIEKLKHELASQAAFGAAAYGSGGHNGNPLITGRGIERFSGVDWGSDDISEEKGCVLTWYLNQLRTDASFSLRWVNLSTLL